MLNIRRCPWGVPSGHIPPLARPATLVTCLSLPNRVKPPISQRSEVRDRVLFSDIWLYRLMAFSSTTGQCQPCNVMRAARFSNINLKLIMFSWSTDFVLCMLKEWISPLFSWICKLVCLNFLFFKYMIIVDRAQNYDPELQLCQ